VLMAICCRRARLLPTQARGPGAHQDLPARIAIALELARLELLQRVQQGDRGARPVADGEWRVAMSAGSSRVFRWPERAWRGPEWPERMWRAA
jgi:hypothetical protein